MSSDRLYTTPDGSTIAYELTGRGRPVGYAHGVLLSRAGVRGLEVFDIDAVAAGRMLLTYDQRGHGHSTGRAVVEDYRFERAATDLLGVLEAAAIDEPIDFAGSSLGAAAVLYAALAAPERFGRLALLIPPVSWETGTHPARQWYADTARRIDEIGPAAWRKEWAQAAPLPIFADYPQAKFSPDVPDELLASVLRGVGLSELPDPEALAALHHRTLILAWDTDPLHPVSTAARLHVLMPHSTLYVARSVADVKTWTQRTAEFFGG
ncbi:alpha/beta fold hydrolase [Mycobacterium hubeiense]|uniref:alpha/beta fold hydrolase n=1 Tax=Mycobacterium hubeiense TaxID=1867256 RepID=UPI000C7E9189|nr:alpha/beta hydrolase [Mycobacterium sp. QGD 101]